MALRCIEKVIRPDKDKTIKCAAVRLIRRKLILAGLAAEGKGETSLPVA